MANSKWIAQAQPLRKIGIRLAGGATPKAWRRAFDNKRIIPVAAAETAEARRAQRDVGIRTAAQSRFFL